jgi:hypothetical protein
MKRRKHSRTNRKDFPLAVDLRDFLMYSNPSRFAPRVKKTGGEAYPQAPTMDQFFSYGAPAPQVPFVFQDGGNTMSFSDPKPNRVGGFLDKIKKLGYEAIQKEMANEGMMMDEAYYQAADEMDLAAMQWGGGWTGGYETNFDAANQWLGKSQDTGDIMGAYGNFVDAASNYASNPDDYYIKRMKYDYKPTAQYGTELQEFQGDFGSSQVNRDVALANAAILRNLPMANNQPVGNPFQMFNVPGAGQATVTDRGRKASGRVIDRNATIAMPDYYIGENSYAGYEPRMIQETPIAARNNQRINFGVLDGKWSPFGSNYPYQQEGDGSILYNPRKQEQQSNQTQNQPVATTTATKGKGKTAATTTSTQTATTQTQQDDTPPTGTVTVTNPDGTQSSISPAEAARRAEEKKGEESNCPDGNCGKPSDAAANTPAPGSVEESKQAAAAGMTPGEYRTFLTHADIKMGPLGRRLRRASFDFATYGPGMTPVTASANQQKPFFYDSATGKMEGAAPNDMRGDVPGENPRDGKDRFFKRLFGRSDEQSRWNPENKGRFFSSRVKNLEAPIGESTFETQGYSDKNYMSDIRNERATNRLNRLGQRIDRNVQRENTLDQLYDTPISDRMQRLRDRDLRRYNRTANRFGRDAYTRPAFQYGGYFQPGGGFRDMNFAQGDPSDEETSQFVTDMQGNQTALNQPKPSNYMESMGKDFVDYSGSDKPLSETYMGDIAPVDLVENQTQMMGEKGKGKLDVKFGKKSNPYAGEFINAGLDLLSAGMTNREAKQNEKMFRSKMGADQVFTPMQDMSKGDYTVNEGYFRPDQQVPVQFSGYNFESPYARYGGSYQKGGEYYLSDEEIQEIINMGGEVEFLD